MTSLQLPGRAVPAFASLPLTDSHAFSRTFTSGQVPMYDVDGHPIAAEELFTPFFGEPKGPIVTDQWNRENLQLPDAYAGENAYIRETLIRMITETDTVWVTRILPWTRHEKSMVIMWNKIHFNNHLLSLTPEQSVPRLTSTHTSADRASMERYAIAFVLEHGFMLTRMGQEHYANNLLQIRNATVETVCYGAAIAIYTAEPYKGSFYDRFQIPIDLNTFEEIMAQEINRFGCVHKMKNAFEHEFLACSQALQRRGVSGALLSVVPNGMLRYIAQSRPEENDFFLKGNSPTTMEAVNAGVYGTIVQSRGFELGDRLPAHDVAFRARTIGSFFTVDDEAVDDVPPEHYRTSMANVKFYSENTDSYQVMSPQTVLDGCGVFDPETGKLTDLGNTYFGDCVSSLKRYLMSSGQYMRFKHSVLRENSHTRASFTVFMQQQFAQLGIDQRRTIPAAAADQDMIRDDAESDDDVDIGVVRNPRVTNWGATIKAICSSLAGPFDTFIPVPQFDEVVALLRTLTCRVTLWHVLAALDLVNTDNYMNNRAPYTGVMADPNRIMTHAGVPLHALYNHAAYKLTQPAAANIDYEYVEQVQTTETESKALRIRLTAKVHGGASAVASNAQITSLTAWCNYFLSGIMHQDSAVLTNTYANVFTTVVPVVNAEQSPSTFFLKALIQRAYLAASDTQTTLSVQQGIYKNRNMQIFMKSFVPSLRTRKRRRSMSTAATSIRDYKAAIKVLTARIPHENVKRLISADVHGLSNFIMAGDAEFWNTYKGLLQYIMVLAYWLQAKASIARAISATEANTISAEARKRAFALMGLMYNEYKHRQSVSGDSTNALRDFNVTMGGFVFPGVAVVNAWDTTISTILDRVVNASSITPTPADFRECVQRTASVQFIFVRNAIQTQADAEDAKALAVAAQAPAQINLDLNAGLVDDSKFDELMDTWTITDNTFFQWCIDNNVPVFIGAICFRPHMTYEMGSMKTMLPGKPLGGSFMGHANFEVGDNVAQKTHMGHFSLYSKSLVMNPEKIEGANDIFCRKYLGGNGHSIWSYTDDDRSDYLKGKLLHDIFIVPIDPNWRPKSSYLDMSGSLPSNVVRQIGDENSPMYPNAQAFAAYWRWHNTYMYNDKQYDRTISPSGNTLCFQDHCIKYQHGRDGTGGYSNVTLNRGHWGPNVYPGCKAVRNGTGGMWLETPAYRGLNSFSISAGST